MNLTEMFSDNQLAVMGSFLALAGCGLITAISYSLGPAGRKQRGAETFATTQMKSGAGIERQRSERRAA